VLLNAARAQLGLPSTVYADIAAGAYLQHLAPDPRPMSIVRTEGGALVERYDDERTAAELDERRRAIERQAPESERAIEAAHQRTHEQALREQLQRELPPHLRPTTEDPA
jgi:hypothetical protein